MNITNAKRAGEIAQEIEELSRYKKLINDRDNGNVAHVNFVQHYGDTGKHDSLMVVFNHKYNSLFIPVFDKIISDLETELDSL
jgi:hypothetical protein